MSDRTDAFLSLPVDEQRRRLCLMPYYADVRNELVQPDRVTLQTRYFWERWARILGPRDTVLFLRLRQLCYFNRETGERRDWCFPSHEGIGADLGLERKAVLRGLARLEAHDLIRREPQYRYDPALRKRVRSSDRYLVQMEDPLVPDDVAPAFARACERASRPDPFAAEAGPKSQIGTLVNECAPKSQKGTGLAVPKRDRKRYFEGVLERMNVTDRTEGLAQDLARDLKDHRSLRFYRIVTATFPEPLVLRALSEARSAAREGRVKKTAGAYFTAALRSMAGEAPNGTTGDAPGYPGSTGDHMTATAIRSGGKSEAGDGSGTRCSAFSPALDDNALARFLEHLEKARRACSS